MEIKILGTGCTNCKTLDKMTHEVVEKNGINANITKVEDILEIIKYGVMSTPALVVDEKVVLSGRVPSREEIIKLLTLEYHYHEEKIVFFNCAITLGCSAG